MTRYWCAHCGRVRDSDSNFHEVGSYPEEDLADVEGSEPCECGSVDYRKGERKTMTETDHDHTEKVEQTETGYRLRVTSTRGTGTRDQDKVEAEARTETLDELERETPALHAVVSSLMDNRRAHQPDEDSDE